MGELEATARRFTMRDYIEEELGVARANLERASELVAPLLTCCGGCMPTRLWIVASGSSGNAAASALPFMRSCLPGCDIRLISPFTFTYFDHEVAPDDVAVVVTQSGLSTNALEALNCLRAQGRRTICLTGNVEADVRDYADVLIDYGVGEEFVGYVTKGVTTLTLFLMLFAAELGGVSERTQDLGNALDVADAVREATYEFFSEHEKELTSLGPCYFMGAGSTWGVALEGALKVGETVHVPSFAYEVEEFIHGPNLQLTPAYTTFFFDAGDAASSRVQQVWRAARTVTDRSYLLTCDIAFTGEPAALVVPTLAVPETASLAYLPFVQLVSYLASDALGSMKQHPLLRKFKQVAAAKTEHFINYDNDD